MLANVRQSVSVRLSHCHDRERRCLAPGGRRSHSAKPHRFLGKTNDPVLGAEVQELLSVTQHRRITGVIV